MREPCHQSTTPSSPNTTDQFSLPGTKELEVSLFGLGIGECVVLHVGSGSWVIIDSCVDRATGNPVALDYLHSLGVDVARAVKRVIITHWHDDHARGIARILKAAESADLVCSAALCTNEFQTLLGMGMSTPLQETGVVEFGQAFEVLKQRPNAARVQAISPIWAQESKVILRTSDASIHSLAPSDATLTLVYHEIGEALRGTASGRRRLVAQTANEVSIVMWVEFGSIRCLLGGDLESQGGDRTGWLAIVDSLTRPPGKALVFKVPHHGSETAYEPRIWSELLESPAYAMLSPWSLGNKAIPTRSDCARILQHTQHLYQTTPTPKRKATVASPSVKKLLRRIAPDLRDLEGPMGHVRIRACDHDTIGVQLFGRAHKVMLTDSTGPQE